MASRRILACRSCAALAMMSMVRATSAGLAPALSSTRTASVRPRPAANMSGVWFHPGSSAFTAAPALSSADTVAGTPASAARCSAVTPSDVVARTSALAASS
jgi:hypothetical protein